MSSPEEFPKTFETATAPSTFRSHWSSWFVWVCAFSVIGWTCFEAYRIQPQDGSRFYSQNKKGDASSSAQLAKRSHQQKPNILFSVIWEGQSLRESNIVALKNLREKHPGLYFYHFMSPGYFARNHQNISEQIKLIRSVIRSSDFVGLHLNGWRSVVERAGVDFKYGENFWGVRLDEHNCFSDCGNDLPMSEYSKGEMYRIVRTSLDLLEEAGFGGINAMMAGGWLATDAVLEAALRAQIKYSYSRVWPSLLKSSIGSFPLMTMIERVWKGVGEDNFAEIAMLPTKQGNMIEMGNSGLAVDFVDADHAMALFNRMLDQDSSDKQRGFHIGIHQETALRYVSRFDQIITRVSEELRRRGMNADLSPRATLFEASKFQRLSH
jgi:hypothetical protein